MRRRTKSFPQYWAASSDSDSDSTNNTPIIEPPVILSDIKATEYTEKADTKKPMVLYLGTNWYIKDDPPQHWTKKDLHEAVCLWMKEYF